MERVEVERDRGWEGRLGMEEWGLPAFGGWRVMLFRDKLQWQRSTALYYVAGKQIGETYPTLNTSQSHPTSHPALTTRCNPT